MHVGLTRSYLQTGAVCVESLNGITLNCEGITLDLQQVIPICIFDMMTMNRLFVSGGYCLSLVCDIVITVASLLKLSSYELTSSIDVVFILSIWRYHKLWHGKIYVYAIICWICWALLRTIDLTSLVYTYIYFYILLCVCLCMSEIITNSEFYQISANFVKFVS